MMIGFCKVIDKFFLDIQGQANIEKRLVSYKNFEEMFSDLAVFLVVQEIAALTWWRSFGFETPELQKVAIKVLNQVIVVSACERNWNTFDFILKK
jgi:hypothetical protein